MSGDAFAEPLRGIAQARIALPDFVPRHAESSLALPPRFSWRGSGRLPPASQQRPWNTCVSHAFAGQHQAMKRANGSAASLDPELFHQCVMGLNCTAGVASLQHAIMLYEGNGLPLAGSGFVPQGHCPAAPLASDAPLRAFGVATPHDARLAIRGRGPVIAIAALEPALVNLRGAAIHHDSGDAPQFENHAMLIVGYDDPAGCWEVQNSLGADWGVGGIGRVAYGSARIFASPDYPVFMFA